MRKSKFFILLLIMWIGSGLSIRTGLRGGLSKGLNSGATSHEFSKACLGPSGQHPGLPHPPGAPITHILYAKLQPRNFLSRG